MSKRHEHRLVLDPGDCWNLSGVGRDATPGPWVVCAKTTAEWFDTGDASEATLVISPTKSDGCPVFTRQDAEDEWWRVHTLYTRFARMLLAAMNDFGTDEVSAWLELDR